MQAPPPARADALHLPPDPQDATGSLSTAALLRRWFTGILGSWAVVWAAGPWVVNSILVRVQDPALRVATLRPGDLIRWRSEGWGDTLVGPHGLPGWQPHSAATRIILWGDSQVEGVCVHDPQKIHSQVIGIAQSQQGLQVDCVPMGRSGSDARLWRDLMDEAQALWDPELHVWVITDLSDLTSLARSDDERSPPWEPSPRWVRAAAALRAEAIFAAGRRVLLSPIDGQRRRLNFSVGPRTTPAPGSGRVSEILADDAGYRRTEALDARLAAAVATEIIRLSTEYDGALAILYAPASPTLGRPLVTAHPEDALFQRIRDALPADEIAVIDMRSEFGRLWSAQRRLPRGFHNGLPGYVHLNADGNRLIARAIVDLVSERLRGRPRVGSAKSGAVQTESGS